MSVGEGSMKRVAAKAAGTAVKKEAAKAKATTAKAAQAAKKSAASQKKAVKKDTSPQGTVPVKRPVNEVVHLTEELPVHLL